MLSTIAIITEIRTRAKKPTAIPITTGAITPTIPAQPPPIYATISNANDVVIMINAS